MIPIFFDYYLESILFVPNAKFDWDKYCEYFCHNAMERKIEYFLQEHHTDISFIKSDGGNHYIFFNTDVVDSSIVESVIERTMGLKI